MSKKSKFKQSYRGDWESVPEFKGWLRRVPDDCKKAYCTICHKTLYAHRLSLLQHSCTVRHSKLAQKKFILEKEQKTSSDLSDSIALVQLSGEMSETNEEQMEPINSVDLNGVVDTVLNGFNGSVISASDYVETNLYILPQNCFNTSCDQVQESAIKDLSSLQSPSYKETELTPDVRDDDVALSTLVDSRPPVSTHVLDTDRGMPAQNMGVCLYQLVKGRWILISECITNADGRCDSFITREQITPGRFKLNFDVYKYFELRKQQSFYPFIEIVFDVRSPSEHNHIPLILSPFGYSTYKGS